MPVIDTEYVDYVTVLTSPKRHGKVLCRAAVMHFDTRDEVYKPSNLSTPTSNMDARLKAVAWSREYGIEMREK